MINELIAQCQNETTKRWVEKVVTKALKKKSYEQGEIEHCLDYFHSKNELSANITSIGVEQAIKKAKKWVEKLNQQAAKDVETEEDIETVETYDEGFQFVKLLSKEAYQREGKLMSHCVASYYGKNDVSIFSLRDSFNKPHCTIEFVTAGGEINQIKGKGNGSIHPKYVKMVLSFLDKMGSQVRPSEMAYLGYNHLEGEQLDSYRKIKEQFTGFKEVHYGGNFFLYSGSKPEKKKK